MSLAPTEDRVLEVLGLVGEALRTGRLAPREALSLQGRCSFLLTSIFAKIGRTALPSLQWHASSGSPALSTWARQSLEFLAEVLVDLVPTEVPVRPPRVHQPSIWTDAMFERDGNRLNGWQEGCKCTIGIVVWCPRRARFFVSDLDLSLELLELAFGERETYIGQAEELAAAAAYETFPDVLAGTRPMHYIDNQGALGVLVRGAGHHAPMGLLAHKTALRQRELGCQVWYEYVASKANIADLPSRHDTQLAARMLRKRFRVPVDTTRPIRLPALSVAAQ